MAARKVVKSESGATMSQYDQEVEKRLKALEAAVHSHESGGDVTSLEAKVDDLIEKLKTLRAVRDVL